VGLFWDTTHTPDTHGGYSGVARVQKLGAQLIRVYACFPSPFHLPSSLSLPLLPTTKQLPNSARGPGQNPATKTFVLYFEIRNMPNGSDFDFFEGEPESIYKVIK